MSNHQKEYLESPTELAGPTGLIPTGCPRIGPKPWDLFVATPGTPSPHRMRLIRRTLVTN